jgi:hypothetical protein
MLMTRFDTYGTVEFYCEYCGWVFGIPNITSDCYPVVGDYGQVLDLVQGTPIYSCHKCKHYL